MGTTSSADGLRGCCVNAPGTVDLDIDCSGIDDSGHVYLNVTTTEPACVGYDLDWGDD